MEETDDETIDLSGPLFFPASVQVNLCQKHLFSHQLTHNMTKDLPVQYMKTTSSEHGENMLCTQIVFCFDNQNNLCKEHVLIL